MQNQKELDEFCDYLHQVAAHFGFDFEDLEVFDGPSFNVLCQTFEAAQGEEFYQDEDRDLSHIKGHEVVSQVVDGLTWREASRWAEGEMCHEVHTALTSFQDYFGPRALFERDEEIGAGEDWNQAEVDEAHAPQYVASWVVGVEYRPVDTGLTADTSFVRVMSPGGQSQIHTAGLVGQMMRGGGA